MDEVLEVPERFVVAHFAVAGEVERVVVGVEVDFGGVGGGAEA